MTLFVKHGKDVQFVRPVPNDSVMDHVPAAVYKIGRINDGFGLLFDREKFDVPSKIYGEHAEYKKAVLDDYRKTTTSLGVLAIGAKGTGKSLLAEDLANTLISMDVPVIYVEESLPADLLRNIIRGIGPCGVIFEEFVKQYPEETSERTDQTDLLTLFSDTGLKKVLFLLTDNCSSGVSNYLLNRPGRIRYFFKYKTPGFQVLQEIRSGQAIPPDIYVWLKKYLDEAQECEEVGIDGLLYLNDLISQSSTLCDLRRRIEISNLPTVFQVKLTITETEKYVFARPKPDENGRIVKVTNKDTGEVSEIDLVEEVYVAMSEQNDDQAGFYTINIGEEFVTVGVHRASSYSSLSTNSSGFLIDCQTFEDVEKADKEKEENMARLKERVQRMELSPSRAMSSIPVSSGRPMHAANRF